MKEIAMDAALLYGRFSQTKQDKEKLRIAMELCLYGREERLQELSGHSDCTLCLYGKEERLTAPEVEHYLRLRQRPAAELLIRQGDLAGMRSLMAFSWFERKYLPDYLRLAQEAARTELVAELLQEWYGMRGEGNGASFGIQSEIGGYGCGAERKGIGGDGFRHSRGREVGQGLREGAVPGEWRTKNDAGRVAREILHLTIQSLMQRFPFLGGALLALEPVQMESGRLPGQTWTESLSGGKKPTEGYPEEGRRAENRMAAFGTDGERLYYDPLSICQLFRQDPRSVEVLALHSLFHCLLCHICLPCRDGEREGADRAADRMVEEQLFRMVEEELGKDVVRGREGGLQACWGDQAGGFLAVCDCHDFWPSRRDSCGGDDLEHMELLRRRWQRLAAGGGGGGLGLIHSQNGGGLRQEYGGHRRKAYDYRRFLEQFMVRREECMLDTENFDPIWYYYSRSQYEGLALLEPLETREVTRLEELMIAIDTSASCSGKVVERFLDETFAILERQEHFFHRMNVHIVQCDCMIQEHVRITCERQWRNYREHLEIRGLGDTDFTPVFALAGKLERTGQVKNLKGILYFTDGDGIFPRKAPPWPSAFVFLDQELEKHELPDWAIRLNLSEG